MRDRRLLVAAAALGLLAVSARHPTAHLQVLTHDVGDPAPHRLAAALDLGVMGVQLLVTWTGHHLR